MSKLKNNNTIVTLNNKNNIFENTRQIIKSPNAGPTIIIPHVCNNINLFGAGFASAVAEEYPIVKENFHLLGKNTPLGHVQNITVLENKSYGRKLIVSNMIAQNGIISNTNKRPLNYGALSYCMYHIKSLAREILKTTDSSSVEIHAPKFGSGLSGGNWLFIEELIRDIWLNELNVFVYIPKIISKKQI